MNSSKNNKFRNLTHMLNIRNMQELIFLTSNAKKIFNYLRQVFIKSLILWYFDPKSHIQIKINASSYAIAWVLTQLNLISNASTNSLNKSDFSQ